jgi:hypothetical protein
VDRRVKAWRNPYLILLGTHDTVDAAAVALLEGVVLDVGRVLERGPNGVVNALHGHGQNLKLLRSHFKCCKRAEEVGVGGGTDISGGLAEQNAE